MPKTESPISTIPRTDKRNARGFTLVELIIGATISAFILLGVITSFLHMGRMAANVQNYSEIEAKARKALEIFSHEIRLAHKIGSTFNSTSVTLHIPDTTAKRDSTLYTVTYTFDTANKKFTRTGPPVDNPTGTSVTTDIVTEVQQVTGKNPLNYYRLITTGYVDGFNTANKATDGHPLEVKQIEINFLLSKTSKTVVAATNKVFSARFILRNK